MGGWQTLLQKILPKEWATDMEAESRLWMMRCQNCGKEISVWEAGGIRWKAHGNPSRYQRCRHCGNNAWHTLYKKG